MVFIKSDAMKADIAGRKDRIVAAAIAIAATHGAEAATITAVARRSRVSAALICKYFADRPELMAAALERLRVKHVRAIEAASHAPGAEALVRSLAVIYNFMGSRNLNAMCMGSPVYRAGLSEAVRGVLHHARSGRGKESKIVCAAILGAARGIAEEMPRSASVRREFVIMGLLLVGYTPGTAGDYASRYSNVRVMEEA